MTKKKSSATTDNLALLRIARLIQVSAYFYLIAFFSYLALTTADDLQAATAQRIQDLLFVQFFCHFLTTVLGVNRFRRMRLVEQLFIAGIFGGFGVILLNDLNHDRLVITVWLVSIVVSWVCDGDDAVLYAVIRGGWQMVAAFIIVLVGSIAGENPETLISTNLKAATALGILCYVGFLAPTLEQWWTNFHQSTQADVPAQ